MLRLGMRLLAMENLAIARFATADMPVTATARILHGLLRIVTAPMVELDRRANHPGTHAGRVLQLPTISLR